MNSQSLYDNFFDDNDKTPSEVEESSDHEQVVDKEEFIKKVCDDLTADESVFEKEATQFKSAQQIKDQYRASLKEALETTDFEEKMNLGVETIQQSLPTILLPAECEVVYQEFANYVQNRENFSSKTEENQTSTHLENDEDDSESPSEKSEISEKTFQSLYSLGLQLIQQSQFEEAEAVFTVLLFLNQKRVDFWLGAGVALYSNLKFEEALEYFDFAKILDPHRVGPFYHSAFCNQKLGKEEELQNDRAEIERIFSESEDEKNQWESLVSQLANSA